MNIGRFIPFVIFVWILLGTQYTAVYAQSDSTKTTTEIPKVEKPKPPKTAVGKGLKAIENALSFKNFFHHSDSARLARRYIRWHQKITRGRDDYRYKIIPDSSEPITPYVRESENELAYEVMGWYPSWDENLYKTLNYSLLSTIAYFSYEVDPKTGSLTIADGKSDSLFIKTAKEENKRVLLTITNFGNENNRKFLKNGKAGDRLISELKALLKNKNVDGVCLDFEGVVKSQRTNFSSFVTQLKQEINSEEKKYFLYLTLPAVDWSKSLEFEALIPVVDRFAIMGYDYYGTTSKVAGPVAPLESGKEWDPFNLTTSVDYYLANKIPADKLILALPFFGYIWDTRNGEKGSKVDKFVGSRTYDYIVTAMTKDATKAIPEQFDSVSQSGYYSFIRSKSNGKRQFRQIWFETDSTMLSKIQLIKDKGLRGMGIWALGYNKYRKNYWKVIESNLCNRDSACALDSLETASIVPGEIPPTGASTLGLHDGKNSFEENTEVEAELTLLDRLTDFSGMLAKIDGIKELLLLLMAFVVVFGGLGFLISMFKSDTRMFFFGSKAQMIYYTAIVLFFLLMVLRWDSIFLDSEVALFLGFTIGAIAIYLISRYVQKIKRDLP